MTQEIAHLAREVIASYEARVSSVEQIVESTHEMLETFRRQRDVMRAELREALARAASLRRRDFDAIMQGIVARQEAREQGIKATMRGYLQEQRALAATLKEALRNSEAGQSESVRELLSAATAKREERERQVRSLLAEFQREQEELTGAVGRLLSSGGPVRVRQFKAALGAIQTRGWVGEVRKGTHGDNQMRVLSGEGVRSL